jgi:hypothetical protein
MAGQGNLIVATDYNTIQSKIALILGTGSSDYGYCQQVSSSQVNNLNTKITVTQWNNLRTDLLLARQHQTGSDQSARLALPTTSTTIKEADRSAYNSFADEVTTNRLVTPPSSQYTLTTIPTVTRTNPWSYTVSYTLTLNFPGYTSGTTVVSAINNARAFFNAGGLVKFSASFTNYTSDGSLTVNQSWATLLANMGTINFGAHATTNTGSGTPQAKGFFDLTNSDQLMFTKLVDPAYTPTYSPNQYDLYARFGTTQAQIIFTPTFSYTGGGNIHEAANGTLSSGAQVITPTGSNVSVGIPTYVNSVL